MADYETSTILKMNLSLALQENPKRTVFTPLSVDEELFLAVENNDLKSSQQLIQKGANLQGKWEGWTPLTFACERGRSSVAQLIAQHLIEESQKQKRKNYNLKSVLDEYDDHGDTALVCAARNGHVDICQDLVNNGACINQTTQYVHQSILHVAIEYNQSAVVDFLLKNGANVQTADNVKISPLYTAIKGRNPMIVMKLIESGCDVNIGSQDHSPLFLATRLGLLSIVQMLCEAGCDKNLAISYGVTPVYEASLKGHLDILQYLIEEGCDVNKCDMYGVSPLHIACMYGNVPMVDMLLQGGAKCQLRMQQGQTALQAAMESNKADIVEYFLTRGADIMTKPHGNKSLSSIAAVFDRGHKETVEVLLRGCPGLPLQHYPGLTEMFSENPQLMKMLFLSGIQTIPGVLTIARLHPRYINDKEVSSWLQKFQRNPQSLTNICRVRIRKCLGNKVLCTIHELPLPRRLKDLICLRDM